MKKVRFTAISIVFLFFLNFVNAQNSPLDSIGFFELNKEDLVHIDNLGNLFILKENILTSENLYNNQKFSYSNIIEGNIEQFDVRNPFKIWLYNSDLGQLSILDKTLSLLSEVNFTEKEFGDVSLFCSSKTSGLWIYDDLDTKIYRTDQRLNIEAESIVLNTLFEDDIEILDMLEIRNQLCLLIKNKGLFIFDYNGNFVKKYPLPKSVDKINYFIGQIYFQDEDIFKYINIHSGEQGDIRDFKPEPGFSYIFNGNFMLRRGEKGVTVFALYLR